MAKARATGEVTKNNGVYDQTVNVGLNLNWTIFDGFNISTTYKQLKELERQGETNTRIAIEDFIADLASEYYNFIQQKIRLKNFHYAMSLSKERLRIAEASHLVGKFSGLDYQQAKVDFNADSAQYIKQQELLHSSRIQLNELMANNNVNQIIVIKDSTIDVHSDLLFDDLWECYPYPPMLLCLNISRPVTLYWPTAWITLLLAITFIKLDARGTVQIPVCLTVLGAVASLKSTFLALPAIMLYRPQWLACCPYYAGAYLESDIRIMKVSSRRIFFCWMKFCPCSEASMAMKSFNGNARVPLGFACRSSSFLCLLVHLMLDI